jgi:HAD superfamily hydrolase (TIGR01509 family)
MRALIFDLDGLILDTESTDFAAWQSIYRDHGAELPRERWVAGIGTQGLPFDLIGQLEEQIGRAVDADALHAERRRRRNEAMVRLGPLPGVVGTLDAATRLGLRTGVASSSPRDWVEGHLERLGLLVRFEALLTSDDVARAKPDPELYRAAIRTLRVDPTDAVALEDSPHGVAAAKAAGLFCIAVPGPMTRGLSFTRADLVVDSLEALPLEEVLADLSEG